MTFGCFVPLVSLRSHFSRWNEPRPFQARAGAKPDLFKLSLDKISEAEPVCWMRQQLEQWSVVKPTWLPSSFWEARLHGHKQLTGQAAEKRAARSRCKKSLDKTRLYKSCFMVRAFDYETLFLTTSVLKLMTDPSSNFGLISSESLNFGPGLWVRAWARFISTRSAPKVKCDRPTNQTDTKKLIDFWERAKKSLSQRC